VDMEMGYNTASAANVGVWCPSRRHRPMV
jgi:hypothetical protein